LFAARLAWEWPDVLCSSRFFLRQSACKFAQVLPKLPFLWGFSAVFMPGLPFLRPVGIRLGGKRARCALASLQNLGFAASGPSYGGVEAIEL
jgi:hypothetical protein